MSESLVYNLWRTKTIVDEIDGLISEYNYYKRPPLSKIGAVGVGIAVWWVSFVLCFVLARSFNYLSLFEVIIVPLWIGVLFPQLYSWYMRENKLRKHRLRMLEIEDEVEGKVELLKSFSEVPRDYWYSYGVNSLLSYFQNKRADTLKEALNLLDLDIKHEERMGRLQTLDMQTHQIRVYSAKVGHRWGNQPN